jgi:hypothetical protein
MTTVEQLRTGMVQQMISSGCLRSRPWITAFRNVPRHVFLPRFFRQSADLSGWEAVSGSDPGAMELIYTGGMINAERAERLARACVPVPD